MTLVLAGWAVLAALTPVVVLPREVYPPEDGSLCPGELLAVKELEFWVNLAPNVIAVQDTWWDADRDELARPGTTTEFIVVKRTMNIRRSWLAVVPVLPPGRYEYRIGLRGVNRNPAVATVPFEISSDCLAPTREPQERP